MIIALSIKKRYYQMAIKLELALHPMSQLLQEYKEMEAACSHH
jgi:hypothetical protein